VQDQDSRMPARPQLADRRAGSRRDAVVITPQTRRGLCGTASQMRVARSYWTAKATLPRLPVGVPREPPVS
jgi:hypothetical protein